MKCRKKPIIIEAEKISDIIFNVKYSWNSLPQWVVNAYDNGVITAITETGFTVKTLEGNMEGKLDGYLMKGIDGELYPCDGKIFEKTYDIIE